MTYRTETLKQLVDSSAVVTGGTSGVGLAVAKAFATQGASRVALIGLNQELGEAARQNILSVYPQCEVLFAPADANDLDAVRMQALTL